MSSFIECIYFSILKNSNRVKKRDGGKSLFKINKQKFRAWSQKKWSGSRKIKIVIKAIVWKRFNRQRKNK